MYASTAGAVVFEYTANMEYAELGNTNPVFEKAWLVPLNVILPPDSVAVPTIVLLDPDLSDHDVTVGVEFMVEVSAASIHNWHPVISRGVNAFMKGGVV
jgi:hypothetical protein